jgi:glycosyltransferase involved in cell wall biosynthesis
MKVLALTRYGRLGASSRLRFYQYLPRLEQSGIAVTVAALSSDAYVAKLYAGRRPGAVSVARDYVRRAGRLASLPTYDLLWVEKELFPGAPALVERMLSGLGVPYAVDYDDATFHRYDRSSNPLFRHLWPRKIDAVMRRAALVMAGNRYLADRARAAGARRVEILPTVVDPARYPVRPPPAGAPFTVGWMGTPVTQRYLAPVAGALADIVAGGSRVRLVGADRLPNGLPASGSELLPWAEETEASDILTFDAGIMPLDDTEWERGKCGYKLLQYMAAGRPVVASPVGVNPEIVEAGVTGFLATTAEEWRAALVRLRDDPALRARMGEAGRRRVEARYSIDHAEPRLRALLQSVATGARSKPT